MYQWLINRQMPWPAPRCLLCQDPGAAGVALCRPCRDDLAWIERACRHCALPLAAHASTPVCRACLKHPAFDAALAACHYDDTVAWLITGLKFRGRLAHADVLADLLYSRLAETGMTRPELLVPVPLHVESFRRRGFNQAERIAARLGQRIDVPVLATDILRSRATRPQSGLRAAHRAANVRGAFLCRRDLAHRHVAIVDDVVTTTHTAAALAGALRAAGAVRIDCLSPARA